MDSRSICLLCLIFVTSCTPDDNGKRGGNSVQEQYDFQNEKNELGHTEMENDDSIIYSDISTDQIVGSIQLGIQHAIKHIASEIGYDLLLSDFETVELFEFPSMGSQYTSPHHFPDFTIYSYAPMVFHHFRNVYGIQDNDYQKSLLSSPLNNMSSSGASGSTFYITSDNKFILKSVQKKESKFLLILLHGYYLNLNQNPNTLLPKFLSHFSYEYKSPHMFMNLLTGKKKKKISFVIMKNIFPPNIKMHQKYDIKGSTLYREASVDEIKKSSPTYKDLDFRRHHPNGIFLKSDVYSKLINTLERDCRVLQSLNITDYSLLIGVHNVTAMKDRKTQNEPSVSALYDIVDEENYISSIGGIPAYSYSDGTLALFVGIIDVLQNYRMKKYLENKIKSKVYDADSISVQNSDFYAKRFLEFTSEFVFKELSNNPNKSPIHENT